MSHDPARERLMARAAQRSLVPRRAPGADAEPIPAAFLLAFVRRLIAETGSGDKLLLSLWGAADDVGATKPQADRFLAAIRREHETHSIWPKGFF